MTRGWILVWILLDLVIVLATAKAPLVLGLILGLGAFFVLQHRPYRALAFAMAGLPLLDWIRIAGLGTPGSLPLEILLLGIPLLFIAWMDFADPGSKDAEHGVIGRTLRDPVVVVALLLGLLLLLGLRTTPAHRYGQSKALLYFIVCLPFLIAGCVLLGRVRSREALTERGFQFLRAIVFFEMLIAVSGILNLVFEIYPYRSRLNVLALNVIWLARHMGLGLLCTLLLLSAGQMRRLAGIVLVILFTYVFYLAGSRGPLLALLGTFGVWWFVQTRASVAKVLFAGVFLLAAAGGLLFWIEMSAATPFGGHDVSNLARLFLLHAAVTQIGTAGLFGSGTGAFPALLGFGDRRLYPHNLFLEVWVENGLVGFALLVTLVVLVLLRWRRADNAFHREGKPGAQQAWLVRAAGLGWVYALANAQFSGDIPQSQWLWLWTGALAAWAERR